MRYKPEGDRALKQRQAARFKRLSDFLHGSRSRFIFELLVPAEKLDRLKVDDLRTALIIKAVHELQDQGAEPDVWKIEGLDRREDCEKIVASRRSEWGLVHCSGPRRR